MLLLQLLISFDSLCRWLDSHVLGGGLSWTRVKATLNTEMTIGTAFEVKYWPTFAGELDTGMVNFFFVENVRREQVRVLHASRA